jgi:hypothetical protein
MGKRVVVASAVCVALVWACSKDDAKHGGGVGGTSGSGASGQAGTSASGGASGASGRGGSAGATGGSSGKGGRGGTAGTPGGASGKSGGGGSAGASGGRAGSSGRGGSAGDGDAGESAAGGASGGEDGGGGEGGQVDPGLLITPEEGGKVSIDGATLGVGPGAVAVSTAVTASSSPTTAGLPRASDLRGLVYTFGPDGLVFDEPVILALPVTGAPPFGKQWAVAWLDETSNQWIPLPTIVSSGRAVTSTQHFTSFTILEWNRVDVPGDCELPAPCGGTPSGQYDLGGSCYTGPPPAGGSLSFCPTGGFAGGLMLSSGGVTFGPGNEVFRVTTLVGLTRMVLTTACLTTFGGMVGSTFATCRELEGPLGAEMDVPLVCDGNVSQSCTCYAPNTFIEQLQPGTFATNGTTLTLTTPSGTATLSYCVEGENLSATDSSDFNFLYVR